MLLLEYKHANYCIMVYYQCLQPSITQTLSKQSPIIRYFNLKILLSLVV